MLEFEVMDMQPQVDALFDAWMIADHKVEVIGIF